MGRIVSVGVTAVAAFGTAAKANVVAEEPNKLLAITTALRTGNMYAAAKHINAIMPKDKGAEPARNLYAHADYDGCLTLTDVSGRIPLLSIQKPMEGQDLTVIAPIDKSGDLLFSQAILDNSINADEAHSPLRKLIQGVLALAESSRSTTATMIAGVIENHEIVGLFNTSAPNGPALTEHLKIASPAASVKSY